MDFGSEFDKNSHRSFDSNVIDVWYTMATRKHEDGNFVTMFDSFVVAHIYLTFEDIVESNYVNEM